MISFGDEFDIPKHCHECGNLYPWTQRKIDAAKEFTDELDKLSKEEKDILKQSIEDIISNKPNSDAAVLRFKKLVAKAGNTAYEGLKDILISVLTEAAKKKMGF